ECRHPPAGPIPPHRRTRPRARLRRTWTPMTAPLVDLSVHHTPKGVSDRVAFGFVKALRFFADTFFAKRYGHRAVVLETVAAVPGMVGATLNHLKALRRMKDDNGWIRTLMDEAENERMHLMTF